ncbi:MAG: DUF2799 domain-containing protein [Pseudomonadota bacterium]
MKLRALVVFLILGLSGCATMTVDQCATADWRAIGYEDGVSGEMLTKADKRGKACSKHGYVMNRDAYDVGRDSGLNLYCTEETGFALGESGKPYNGVCSAHDEAQFVRSYDRGYEMFRFTASVAMTQAKLLEAKNKHKNLDKELQKYDSGYRDEGLTMEEHNNMVLEIWAERKYLKTVAIPHWTHEKRAAQRELDAYRAKMAAGDPSLGSLRPREVQEPRPYTGATKADAREMVAEVFSRLKQ